MLTIKLEVSDKKLNEVFEDVRDFYGLILPHGYIKKMLRTYIGITADLVDAGFDTIVRENFTERVALDLTNLSWPMNGDNKETKKKFEIALKKAVKGAKIKLEDDWSCGGEKW